MPIVTTVKEDLAEKVGDLLRGANFSLSVAESCTGGLLSNLITNVSGSSDYFDRGFVTYSDNAKIELLGVLNCSLLDFGAVSRVVAEQMAEGARRNSGTDIGISTTGFAGPTGGTTEKPIGLVFIGIATSDGVVSEKFNFSGDRLDVKRQTAEQALDLLFQFLTDGN